MHASSTIFMLSILGACTELASAPPPVKATTPIRGTAGDSDLRVMLSELASSKACAVIRGGFHGLRLIQHPDHVTGALWIRECKISNVGARVTFRIAGNGWSWIDEKSSKATGTFAVRQYVRFRIAATIRGELDIAYDRSSHVASVWFTPARPPEVSFQTIGDIDVDSQDVWSSVVGAVGAAFSSSPEEAALALAKTRGARDLGAQLADGVALTIDLCTGLRRAHLGRPARGEMGLPSLGETRRVVVQIEPDGVILGGPQLARDGMTLRATASRGAARLSVVCAEQAARLASAYMKGHALPSVPTLGSIDVRTEARLTVAPTACEVVVVATSLDQTSARIAWERPTSEIAGSTGGPLIPCPSKQ